MTATWATNVLVAATLISRPARVYSDAVGVARGLRAHDVRHGEHGRAALAREAHRGQRVERLAGLRDADHEVAGADHRVAVAVLGRDVHLDRDARPLLDRVAADQARVVGGAAGDDDDALDAAQQLVVELGEVHAVRADGAVGDRLGDGVGLLVDLLEHEGLVAALLGGVGVPVDLVRLALERARRRRSGTRRRRRVSTTSSSSSSAWTVRVWARKAGMPEARNCSPSPRPTISGHSLRAPTSTPGSSAAIGHERVVAAQAVVRAPRGLDEAVLVEVVRDQVRDHLDVGLGA